MILDRIERLSQYIPSACAEKIGYFLGTVTPDMKDGFYEIWGEKAYAKVLSYRTKCPESCRIEAHDAYIDIQSVLSGAEGIDIWDRSRLPEESEYDQEGDVTFFYNGGSLPMISAAVYPGYFAMIFPGESHRPQAAVEGIEIPIRKFVIKIRRDLWKEN